MKKKMVSEKNTAVAHDHFFALNCARRLSFSVCTEFNSSIIAICCDCCDSLIDSTSAFALANDVFNSANCTSICFRTLSCALAASSASVSARALSLLFASVSWAHVSACSAACVSTSRFSAEICSIVSCKR